MKKVNLVLLYLLCLPAMTVITSCEKEETLEPEQNETDMKEDDGLFYVKSDMNGMDMITDNVERMFFIGPDSSSEGTIIEGGRMDTNSGKWMKEEGFVVNVDSLNRITSIMMDGWMCNFYNYTETTCDIAFIHGDGTYECVKGVASRNGKTRSMSGEDAIDETWKIINGVKSSLELALSVCEKPKSLQTAFNAFDEISGKSSGSVSFATNSASMGLKDQLMDGKSDLFSLCSSCIENGRAVTDSLTEKLIGNWELELIDAVQTDINTAEINFGVSGLKDSPSLELNGCIRYMNATNGDANTIPFKVENDTYKLSLPLDSYGNFVGSVSMNAELGFFKRIEFKFDAFDIRIKSVTVEENPIHRNDTVNFSLSVCLEGSSEGLDDIQQFGYYTRHADTAPDYKQVEDVSSISQSAPLTYTLSIERKGFPDENIDYTIYEARTNRDYHIGTYVVLKNGNIVHLDEESIDGLVYKTPPSIEFANVEITETEIVDRYANGTYKYNTYYKCTLEVKGTFWFTEAILIGSDKRVTLETEVKSFYKDSSITFNGKFWYHSTNTPTDVYYYFQLSIHDGNTINSNNSYVFNYNYQNPVLSIGEIPSFIPTPTSRHINLQKREHASFEKIGIYNQIK